MIAFLTTTLLLTGVGLAPALAQDSAAAAAAPELHPLWTSGEDGYHTYRIPAIVATTRGTLLAFCEGRKKGRGDTGNIDLLGKRSTDGGETWSAIRHHPDLEEPICQASLLRLPGSGDGKPTRLLFSNPASAERRVNLTVKLSEDDGETWPTKRTLHAGPSAYSCLVVLADGTIGCLFEGGDGNPYERLYFSRFDLGWLLDRAAEGDRQNPPIPTGGRKPIELDFARPDARE